MRWNKKHFFIVFNPTKVGGFQWTPLLIYLSSHKNHFYTSPDAPGFLIKFTWAHIIKLPKLFKASAKKLYLAKNVVIWCRTVWKYLCAQFDYDWTKNKEMVPPLPPPNLFNLQKALNSCKVKGLSLKQIKQIFLEGESLN